MTNQDCYHIGVDTAKNGDKSAVAVICKNCNAVLISEVFEADAALIIPKKCPHCKINRIRDSNNARIHAQERKAAYERAKREGYAPKEMSMTDISREFSSVFLDCIHPLSPDEVTREGSEPT